MSEQESERTGFVIESPEGTPRVYAIPSLYSFDMDENKIIYDLSGAPTEDWLLMIAAAQSDDASDEFLAESTTKLKHPGLLRALVHVAYRREHRELDFAAIDVVVGKSSQIGNWAAMYVAETKEEPEPENPTQAASTDSASESSASAPAKPTSDSSSETPGNGSRSDSERPGGSPAATGTSGSGTSSPRSVPTRSGS